MVEKITYIAFDGEEFETKEDCVAHEESIGKMNEHIQLFNANFTPIEWNPGDYSRMWDELTYIVIEPHYEVEVEEWWNNTFYEKISSSPFMDMGYDWEAWATSKRDDNPTILVYNYQGKEYWEIFNNIYAEVSKIANALF